MSSSAPSLNETLFAMKFRLKMKRAVESLTGSRAPDWEQRFSALIFLVREGPDRETSATEH